jgi:RNA polymerase sigma-70 factor, ECF subfamily
LEQDNRLIRSLIESTRKGNHNAFEQLFRIHVGYVFAICLRLLANFEDAYECTSKIFFESWKSMSQVRRDTSFILWLKAVAIHSSLQKMGEKDKNKEGKDRGEHPHSRKGLSFLDQEIISLPDSERLVFVLNDIEHYQKEEISDLLFITKDEVENFLNTARQKITNTLIIKSNDALERAINQLPESIEPAQDLFEKISSDMLKNIPDKNEGAEIVKDMDDEIHDGSIDQEKKKFSFKDIFKKKNE